MTRGRKGSRMGAMRKTSTKITLDCCRFTLDKSLSGNKGIWIDLYGNSSSMVGVIPKKFVKFANELKIVANWIEKEGIDYLSNNK